MQAKSFEFYIIESSVLIHGVPHMLSSFALNFQIAVYGYPRFSARITPLAILPVSWSFHSGRRLFFGSRTMPMCRSLAIAAIAGGWWRGHQNLLLVDQQKSWFRHHLPPNNSRIWFKTCDVDPTNLEVQLISGLRCLSCHIPLFALGKLAFQLWPCDLNDAWGSPITESGDRLSP